MSMVFELKLEPVEIDGCAVGVRSKSGDPILKPWRIAASFQHMKQALEGLRCQRSHEYVPCAGNETARSAFYPEQLCNAIHDCLDAHESAHAMPAVGHMLNHLRRWCQVACLSLVRARAPQTVASALIGSLLVQELNTLWPSVRPRSRLLNLKQDIETR